MQLNLFGFSMLDSDLNGKIYSTDIADMVNNALSQCPEALQDREYPNLIATVAKRSKTDRRCRCAIYQEMLELFHFYYQLNRKNH